MPPCLRSGGAIAPPAPPSVPPLQERVQGGQVGILQEQHFLVVP